MIEIWPAFGYVRGIDDKVRSYRIEILESEIATRLLEKTRTNHACQIVGGPVMLEQVIIKAIRSEAMPDEGPEVVCLNPATDFGIIPFWPPGISPGATLRRVAAQPIEHRREGS